MTQKRDTQLPLDTPDDSGMPASSSGLGTSGSQIGPTEFAAPCDPSGSDSPGAGKLRISITFVLTVCALLALFFLAVNVGTLQLSPRQLFDGLFVAYDEVVATIFDLRFPRIFIAMLAGAALSGAGVLLQAVVRNPLADPGIIGVSAGASFFAALTLGLFPSLFYFTPLIACVGAALAFVLVYLLSWQGGLSPLRIILVGVAVSAFFSALTAILGAVTGGSASTISSLIDANISMKTWNDFFTLLAYAVPGLILGLMSYSRCDLLMLDDKTARSLGINVEMSRLALSAIAVLLAAVATAIVGPISFLGLIAPHLARLIVGTRHAVVLPYAMLLGAFLLLLADTLGRLVIAPMEISAAICMSLVGGPVFIILLLKGGKRYGF